MSSKTGRPTALDNHHGVAVVTNVSRIHATASQTSSVRNDERAAGAAIAHDYIIRKCWIRHRAGNCPDDIEGDLGHTARSNKTAPVSLLVPLTRTGRIASRIPNGLRRWWL